MEDSEEAAQGGMVAPERDLGPITAGRAHTAARRTREIQATIREVACGNTVSVPLKIQGQDPLRATCDPQEIELEGQMKGREASKGEHRLEPKSQPITNRLTCETILWDPQPTRIEYPQVSEMVRPIKREYRLVHQDSASNDSLLTLGIGETEHHQMQDQVASQTLAVP